VRKNAEGTLDKFIAAAKELVSDGADAITTNCGFLSIFQKELSAAVGVPVLTSSLMQVSTVNTLLPDSKKAGILTISKSTLSDAHLRAANVPSDTPIGTTEDGAEFSRVILNDELQLNIELARMDNINAALEMKTDHPDLGAIILECTNMSPYAEAIQEAVELPVFSIVNFVGWLHAGLKPRRFSS
jgi:Asp/Glu/hydantoin racemase